MSVRVLNGDCRAILPALDADSFDCVVTSPPYFGLRDYGCEGQIGLEPTLDAYVEAMVDVCRELKRILKPVGTFWLNLGDSYSGSWGAQGHRVTESDDPSWHGSQIKNHPKLGSGTGSSKRSGLKQKDLCGVPWRVAFALQADGWWLRSAIVWAKPNPMPESVTDRPTSAYEMVFLLTKSPTYFYDAEAIKEEAVYGENRATFAGGTERLLEANVCSGGLQPSDKGMKRQKVETRNARNVWNIATQPFKGSHFATMPPGLAERCIKAGCPRGGHVLDPFGGAGTTGLVADRLGRNATLIELNPAYRDMAAERVRADAPLFSQAAE